MTPEKLLSLIERYGTFREGGAASEGCSDLAAETREEIGEGIKRLATTERERCALLIESRARHAPPCTCDSCQQTANDAAAIRGMT